MLVLGLTMCLVLMLGIAIASPANTARAEETDLHIPVSTITATSNYKVEKTTTVAITDELVPVTDLVKVFNDAAQEPTACQGHRLRSKLCGKSGLDRHARF